MEKFIEDLHEVLSLELAIFIDDEYNETKEDVICIPDLFDGAIGEFGGKGVLFGFGLLKLLNDALKYMDEKDSSLLTDEYVNLSALYKIFGFDFFGIRDVYANYCDRYDIEHLLLDDLTDFNINMYECDEEKWNEINEDFLTLLSFHEFEMHLAKIFCLFIFKFNDNIVEIFNQMNFFDLIDNLGKRYLLSYLINRLNEINIPKEYFTSMKTFVNTVDDFIDILCDYEFKGDYDYVFNDSPRKQLYREKDILRDDNLIEFVFTKLNLKNNDRINIFDHCCDNINLIYKAIDYIKSINSDCQVNFYGKLNFKCSYFNTTKVIMHSLLNTENIFVSCEDKDFPFENISLEKMDLVISDHRAKDLTDDFFLTPFEKKFDYPSKVVMIINNNQTDIYSISSMISNDYLESIIRFHKCHILILNTNKLDELKDKFLLIDYGLLDKTHTQKIGQMEKILHNELYPESYEESQYIINSSVDSIYMNDVLESYANFTNTTFSKVISVDDIKQLPYHFNFNHLLYDLKRKPYSLVKQKYIGNNHSKIFEENLEFVPLYSLITEDEDEIEGNIEAYKIEKYGRTFYVKSKKILRNFLLYYLNSDKGKEEYDYFNSSLGFEPDNWFFGVTHATSPFHYIRIPLIDIETQKKVIQAYELNEEHYTLVKKSRNEFRDNILNYEKVLKDMDNFHKMEINKETGKIEEMNTVKRHMLDGLLWPLSISYLNAVHGTHVSNPNEKLDFYLKLFEFITAFIDITLISAIPKEEYDNLKQDLWEGIANNNSYKVTFGTWTVLYSRLLEAYSEQNIYPKFNNELIESLLNSDIETIMNEAREMRNEFSAHGVSIQESRAKQLIDDLKLKINVVYDIFGYLTGFKLFHSVKVLELLEDGRNKYEVISLNGPCDQPIYGEVTFNERLKNNSLYLNNSLDGDLLELNKHLILFEETVEEYKDKHGNKKERNTGRFNLYLFNGYKKKRNKYQIRYKCYQIETDEFRKNMSFDEWDEYF